MNFHDNTYDDYGVNTKNSFNTRRVKTATIKIYRPWGARGIVVDVLYRGRVLASFDCNSELALINGARIWALGQGFTRCKYVKGL